ncbi:uncharacterized protein [Henckelia pumila]|uniref:uncharacterized protein isoform X3 n=1 Tax=Henckelia pumila TaxID=405737 RepID=UPI003C6DBBFE
MSFSKLRRYSTFLDSTIKTHLKNPAEPFLVPTGCKSNHLPLPYRLLPAAKGQDSDFVNVAYSHLIHSEWDKLSKLSSGLTPFRIKHILLKTRKDHVLSLEFFKWVELQSSELNTLDVHSVVLHSLTKLLKFKTAESILSKLLGVGMLELNYPRKVFEALVYSYRMCDSSPRVFDVLFRTYARMKKFRNATDAFCWMREYGFYPTIESCNLYLSMLNGSNHADVALAFYKEMCRCRISPNVYTHNIVIGAFCRVGKLEMAVEVFEKMERKGLACNVVSYNTLIAGYCGKGLLSSGVKLKNVMEKKGVSPNAVTYNTLINALCKEGKLHEATKLLSEMQKMKVAPTIVTYNTLINGYSESGNIEMGNRLFEEMAVAGIKADIITYNAVIKGMCKEGKTKKAAYMVKKLDNEKLVPNASTFAALITDYSGAVQVLREMIGRAIAPDSETLSYLCNGLCQCDREELAMDLCKEIECQRLMPEGFGKAVIKSVEYA